MFLTGRFATYPVCTLPPSDYPLPARSSHWTSSSECTCTWTDCSPLYKTSAWSFSSTCQCMSRKCPCISLSMKPCSKCEYWPVMFSSSPSIRLRWKATLRLFRQKRLEGDIFRRLWRFFSLLIRTFVIGWLGFSALWSRMCSQQSEYPHWIGGFMPSWCIGLINMNSPLCTISLHHRFIW